MPRNVAFFGATGGCVNACLAYSLEAGHKATALVRSSKKLRQQLQQRQVPDDVIEKQLNIIQGDVRDLGSVTATLNHHGTLADTVISGIGGVPKLQSDLLRPLTTETNICTIGTSTILAGLAQINPAEQPLLVVISANGVLYGVPRDYPLLYTPLYGWLLRGIYDDKRAMERSIEEMKPSAGYVIIRPSVLMDTVGRGLQHVREGFTEKPAVGYSIGRDDVGLWIFENLVAAKDRSRYLNRGVSITY